MRSWFISRRSMAARARRVITKGQTAIVSCLRDRKVKMSNNKTETMILMRIQVSNLSNFERMHPLLRFLSLFGFWLLGNSSLTAQISPVLQSGHSTESRYAAFSPLGKWLLTWSDDGRLLRWDLTSLQHYQPFEGLNGDVRWLVFINAEEFILQTYSRVVFKGHVDSARVYAFDTLAAGFTHAHHLIDRSNDLIVLGGTFGKHELSLYYPDKRMIYNLKDAKELGKITAMAAQKFATGIYLADENKSLWYLNLADYNLKQLVANDSLKLRKMALAGSQMYLLAETPAKKLSAFCRTLNIRGDAFSGETRAFPLENNVKDLCAQPEGNGAVLLTYHPEKKWWLAEWDNRTSKAARTIPANKNMRLIQPANGALIGILNADGISHGLYHTELKTFTHRLGKQVQSVTDMTYDHVNGVVHVYSGTGKTLQHLNLSGLELDRTRTPLGSANLAFVFDDGGMVQASENLKLIYMYTADGKSDSVGNPLRWLPIAVNRKYRHLAGPANSGGKSTVLDLNTKTIIRDDLPKPGSFIMDVFYSEDGHFLYIETERRKFEIFSVPDYRKVGIADLNKFAGKDPVIENFYMFSDSGHFISFFLRGYRDDRPISTLVTLVRKKKNRFSRHAQLEFDDRVKAVFPGRNEMEILVLAEPPGSLPEIHAIDIALGMRKWKCKVESSQIRNARLLPGGQLMVRGSGGAFRDSDFGSLSLHDTLSGERLFDVITDNHAFAVLAADGSMMCSKGGSELIAYHAYVNGMERIVPGRALEMYYNKPHEVLKRLGSNDKGRIDIYATAYQKRIKRSGTGSEFALDSLPQIWINGLNSRGLVAQNANVTLPVNYRCNAGLPARYHVVVNGVPMLGPGGIAATKTEPGLQEFIYLYATTRS
jgi:hypothetical protein